MTGPGTRAPVPGSTVAYPSLAWLLDPLPVDTFLREYWGKKPLHISRDQPGYYSFLFSLAALDEFIGHSPTNEEIRMAKDNRGAHPNVKGPDRTTLGEFYDLYYQGHTVVVRNIHLRWPPIAELGNQIIRSFGCAISTHLYPTPEKSQGFGTHWDDHDIFALQLEGEKEWCLYDTGPEAPRYSTSRREYRRHVMEDEPAKPSHVITLRAGDLLYFPRGVIHRARAQTLSSLHLTYGLYPETWETMIAQAIRGLAQQSPALGRALPAGFASGTADMTAVGAELERMLPDLLRDLDFAGTYQRLAASIASKTPPLPGGHFAELAHVDAIQLDTLVEKRPGMFATVSLTGGSATGGSVTGGSATMSFPGGSHQVSEELISAVRFVRERERFRAQDLPGPAAAEERLALVRTLVAQGFLRRAAGATEATSPVAPT